MIVEIKKAGAGGLLGTSIYSYYKIIAGQLVEVPANTEMFVTDYLTNNGIIDNKGRVTVWDLDDIKEHSVVTVNADTTLNAGHDIVLIDSSSNTVTVTLPAAASRPGRDYELVCVDSTNTVTIDANGSETISGDLTITLMQYESITIISDGSNWWVK